MNRHSLSISSFKENLIFFSKAMFLFAVIVLWCFNAVMPQYSGGYDASLIDKVERLNSINTSKIVLLGNSNLTFGMDSERLEKAFNMPVVNMGLHGSLGNSFHEEMAKLNVCEGDIYIICHSNFMDGENIPDRVLTWLTVENHYELWRILKLEDIYPMIKAYPTYLKKCLKLFVAGEGNNLPGGCYSRDAFNQYGDIYLERAESRFLFEEPVNPPKIDDKTIKRINNLNEWLVNRGATLLIAGYPIGAGTLTAPEEEFLNIQNELSEQLLCPVISDYRDYMFDYSLFYEPVLHMTTQGAILRTEQLIEDLKAWKNSEEK